MEFLRGIRCKTFTADVQLETEPTLLYGVFLTVGTVGSKGILKLYDGQDITAELIAEFCVSYDFGTTAKFPIQFPHAVYCVKDAGLAAFSMMWLTNEQAMAMFHNEMELKKWHTESKPHTLRDALRHIGII